jgi:Flp pilus assembly protein TadB
MTKGKTNARQATEAGGLGLVGSLTALIICLKLTGVINWSWWWVFSPVWFAGAFGAVVIAIGVLLLVTGLAKKGKQKEQGTNP